MRILLPELLSWRRRSRAEGGGEEKGGGKKGTNNYIKGEGEDKLCVALIPIFQYIRVRPGEKRRKKKEKERMDRWSHRPRP